MLCEWIWRKSLLSKLPLRPTECRKEFDCISLFKQIFPGTFQPQKLSRVSLCKFLFAFRHFKRNRQRCLFVSFNTHQETTTTTQCHMWLVVFTGERLFNSGTISPFYTIWRTVVIKQIRLIASDNLQSLKDIYQPFWLKKFQEVLKTKGTKLI